MNDLAKMLRLLQIYSQEAHHFVARVPFIADHEFLGEIYTEVDVDYDSVVERIIGLNGEEAFECIQIYENTINILKTLPLKGVKENSTFFQTILKIEQEICSLIKNKIELGVSPGTEQLLGNICDKSEIRQYKIKQRIKK